jgi:hypothetical protein
MTQREVAKALGISRTWVQVLEYRALIKVALATGGLPPPLPKWQRQYVNEERRLARKLLEGP